MAVDPGDLVVVTQQLAVLAAASLALLLVFLLVARVFAGFREAGFTRLEAVLILLVAPLLGFVHVPVYTRGNLVLALSLGGVVLPFLVATGMILAGRAPRVRTLVATVLVAIAAYGASELVPGEGVRVAILGPVALAAVLGLAFSLGNFRRAGPLTYAAGTLGILLGADLLRLDAILAVQPPERQVASLGGAGVLDAVFLVGVVAVLLHLALWGLLGPKRRG